jgi:hypothetical protein
MKLSRKAHLWLADRVPAFDRPSLYRRSPGVDRVGVSGWDAVLIALISVVLICAGVAALVVGLFLAVTIITAAF